LSQPILAKNEYAGIPVSAGVVKGKVLVYDVEVQSVPRREIPVSQVKAEEERLRRAIAETRQQIISIIGETKAESSEVASVLQAHLQLLDDPAFCSRTVELIETKRINAEYALHLYVTRFSEHLRRRTQSLGERYLEIVQDITRRVLHRLLGSTHRLLAELAEPVVVVAHDLSPADTAAMDSQNVIAFATEIGGPTSHTAIMARSLEIPAIVGVRGLTRLVKDGDAVIIDGNRGLVTINPDAGELKSYEQARKMFLALEQQLDLLKDLEAETLDGYRIELSANIELPSEIESVKRHGARGVGLFRTEFLFLSGRDAPDEEEQFQSYRQVAEAVAPDVVIIRTVDLGGDKFSSHIDYPQEMNPFLGWRAIRFCLDAGLDIFRTQLRAILRASHYGEVKIMYPMISSVQEVLQCGEILKGIMADLEREGVPYDRQIEVGVMIEVPSAALVADVLAREVDFFSIGTNDLIQYTLAVDRNNERMAYLYEPLHPSVLRLIKNTIDAGHAERRWVGVCGEMAGDPTKTAILLGLGVDELSMSPVAVPEVKRAIRSIRYEQIKGIGEEVLRLSSAAEITQYIKELTEKMASEESRSEITQD